MTQYSETTIKRFLQCGIGRTFLDMKLADFGPLGEEIRKWALDENGVGLLKEGKGVNIIGDDLGHRNALGLIAANLMRERKAKVYLVSVTKLLGIISPYAPKDSYYPEELEDCEALFIQGLHRNHKTKPGEPVYPPKTVDILCDYLMERAGEGLAISGHFSAPIGPAMYWSKDFLQHMASNNYTITAGVK